MKSRRGYSHASRISGVAKKQDNQKPEDECPDDDSDRVKFEGSFDELAVRVIRQSSGKAPPRPEKPRGKTSEAD